MTVPCGMLITMKRKIKAFLGTTFAVYKMPDGRFLQAIDLSDVGANSCYEAGYNSLHHLP